VPFLVVASLIILVEMILLGWLFNIWDLLPIGEKILNSSVLAAVLAGTAVGIERVIEFGWTVVGLTKGATWPLVEVGGKIDELAANLDTSLQPFYAQATAAIASATTVANAAPEKIAAAEEALNNLQTELGKLKGKINSQQLESLLSIASARIEQISQLSVDLNGAASVAKQAISVLSSVADSFKDQPGRRLLSLYAGVFLGLLVSSTMGLDIFQVQPEGSTAAIASSTPLGVIFTGLVLGFGSSPTHEVIKLVQEVKKNFKKGNATEQPGR
jgi:hypothetical protein